MMHAGKLLVVGALVTFALGCFGSGGSDGAAGDGAIAGMGAGTHGASGMGATAGMGAGGTGVVTGTGGAGEGNCGGCFVPVCASGETPTQPPGDCCPSCLIDDGGGTGGAGGTGGDDDCTGKACGTACTWVSGSVVQPGKCDPGGSCFPGDPVCNIENTTDCSCPDTPPTAGSACEPCAPLLSCTYNDCGGAGRTVATCAANAWQVETEACSVTQCDGLQCGEQVCLTIQGQAAGDKRCVDDPCPGGPLTCECAASLCTGEFNADVCGIFGPNHVKCTASSSGCTPDGICPP